MNKPHAALVYRVRIVFGKEIRQDVRAREAAFFIEGKCHGAISRADLKDGKAILEPIEYELYRRYRPYSLPLRARGALLQGSPP